MSKLLTCRVNMHQTHRITPRCSYRCKQSLHILWTSLCSLYKSGYIYIHICVAFKKSCSPAVWIPALNHMPLMTPLQVWKSEGERAESVQYPSSEWSRRVEGSQSQCRVLLVSEPRDRVTDTDTDRERLLYESLLKTQCYDTSEQLRDKQKSLHTHTPQT